MSDAFAVLLSTATFVIGLGTGLFLATTRYQPIQKGKPVSERRLRTMHVIDPLLERGAQLEHHHPTVYRKREHR